MWPGTDLFAVAKDHFQYKHSVLDRLHGIASMEHIIHKSLYRILAQGTIVSENRQDVFITEQRIDGVGGLPDVLALVRLPQSGDFGKRKMCHGI